ncbi:MAG: hypothetical protein K9J30_13305 [Bacteroidales bacterium]|nr:hypothetical protein [Bacteroidales bacterium]
MKIMNILLIAMVFLFTNCENNDKEIINHEDNDTLFVGKWELIGVTGGFAPNENFNDEKIMWEFSPVDSVKITIDTVLSDKSRLPFKADTVLFYNYDSLNISIGDSDYEYELQDKEMKLIDDLASDGIMLKFEKK